MTTPIGPRPRGALPMRYVIGLTIVVTGFAAAIALWMYWIAAGLA